MQQTILLGTASSVLRDMQLLLVQIILRASENAWIIYTTI